MRKCRYNTATPHRQIHHLPPTTPARRLPLVKFFGSLRRLPRAGLGGAERIASQRFNKERCGTRGNYGKRFGVPPRLPRGVGWGGA